jgi:predicted nucleic acid-binding protein
MIVLDASVWISHLILHDVHHAVSRRWFTQTVDGGVAIVVPALLPAEVAGAISRRTGDPELGSNAVEHILTTPNLRLVILDRELSMQAARLAAAYKLRGADATYVAMARRLNIPLITWDREQLERAGRHITAQTPDASESG